MTCLAVWAAIRPKSSGVSSHSRIDVAVLVELLAVDADLPRLGVDGDDGLLGGARPALVGGDQRVGQRVEEGLDRDPLVARDLAQGVEEFEVGLAHGVATFFLPAGFLAAARGERAAWRGPPPRRARGRLRSPFEDGPGPLDLVVGQAALASGHVLALEHEAFVRRRPSARRSRDARPCRPRRSGRSPSRRRRARSGPASATVAPPRGSRPRGCSAGPGTGRARRAPPTRHVSPPRWPRGPLLRPGPPRRGPRWSAARGPRVRGPGGRRWTRAGQRARRPPDRPPPSSLRGLAPRLGPAGESRSVGCRPRFERTFTPRTNSAASISVTLLGPSGAGSPRRGPGPDRRLSGPVRAP